jgi:hypothetical protein
VTRAATLCALSGLALAALGSAVILSIASPAVG